MVLWINLNCCYWQAQVLKLDGRCTVVGSQFGAENDSCYSRTSMPALAVSIDCSLNRYCARFVACAHIRWGGIVAPLPLPQFPRDSGRWSCSTAAGDFRFRSTKFKLISTYLSEVHNNYRRHSWTGGRPASTDGIQCHRFASMMSLPVTTM
jgi:hypothetical protein